MFTNNPKVLNDPLYIAALQRLEALEREVANERSTRSVNETLKTSLQNQLCGLQNTANILGSKVQKLENEYNILEKKITQQQSLINSKVEQIKFTVETTEEFNKGLDKAKTIQADSQWSKLKEEVEILNKKIQEETAETEKLKEKLRVNEEAEKKEKKVDPSEIPSSINTEAEKIKEVQKQTGNLQNKLNKMSASLDILNSLFTNDSKTEEIKETAFFTKNNMPQKEDLHDNLGDLMPLDD